MRGPNARFQLTWTNTHRLMSEAGFRGGKTGVTLTAGPCLCTCMEVDGSEVVVVLLKCTLA